MKLISSNSVSIFLSFTFLFSSGCSVYKSDGRKNLESVGPSYYQNKVSAAAGLVSAQVMNSYLAQYPQKNLYDFCEALDNYELREATIDSKCSFKLSCIELSNLENERHSSVQPLNPRLLLSAAAHRTFENDLICVAR